MTTHNRACGTCTFFQSGGEPTDDGECRRYAPRPVADRRETMWVSVATSDWCGEYDAAG